MCSEMFFSWVNLIVRKMFLIKVELKVNRNKCFCSYCIERSMSIFLTRLFSKSGNTSKISPSLQMRHQESSFRHKFSSGRLHVEVSELEGTWWCGEVKRTGIRQDLPATLFPLRFCNKGQMLQLINTLSRSCPLTSNRICLG